MSISKAALGLIAIWQITLDRAFNANLIPANIFENKLNTIILM